MSSYVTKRNGNKELIQFDKITDRINKLINLPELKKIIKFDSNLDKSINLDPILVAQKVVTNIFCGISTEELDNQSAEICVNLSTNHPLYSYLGGSILVSNLHKKTLNSFTDKIKLLPTINKNWLKYVLNNIIERPQDIYLRTAITLQFGNLDMIKETYDKLSLGCYIHASPTLFNSGSNNMQLSSCFVENTEILTINGIKQIKDIMINDKVITHTGSIKNVLQCHKNKLNDRKIKLLQVHNTKDIYVTDNHKFLTITDNDIIPKWRSVDELTNNHLIAMPLYKNGLEIFKQYYLNFQYINGYYNLYIENNVNIIIYNIIKKINKYDTDFTKLSTYCFSYCDNNNSKIANIVNLISNNFNNNININDKFEINSDIAKLLGIFYGCGYIDNYNDGSKIIFNSVIFVVNNKNIKLITFINKILNHYFNIDIIFYNDINNNIKLFCYSKILIKLFYHIFCNNNEIIDTMFNWSYENLLSFYKGLQSSNFINQSNYINQSNFINESNLKNDILNNKLYHIFKCHGFDYPYIKNNSKILKKKYIIDNLNIIDYYILNNDIFSLFDNNCFTFINNCIPYCNKYIKKKINNNIYLRVLSVNNTNLFDKYVYTLGIEDDHSYNVEGLICKNCFLY